MKFVEKETGKRIPVQESAEEEKKELVLHTEDQNRKFYGEGAATKISEDHIFYQMALEIHFNLICH